MKKGFRQETGEKPVLITRQSLIDYDTQFIEFPLGCRLAVVYGLARYCVILVL